MLSYILSFENLYLFSLISVIKNKRKGATLKNYLPKYIQALTAGVGYLLPMFYCLIDDHDFISHIFTIKG